MEENNQQQQPEPNPHLAEEDVQDAVLNVKQAIIWLGHYKSNGISVVLIAFLWSFVVALWTSIRRISGLFCLNLFQILVNLLIIAILWGLPIFLCKYSIILSVLTVVIICITLLFFALRTCTIKEFITLHNKTSRLNVFWDSHFLTLPYQMHVRVDGEHLRESNDNNPGSIIQFPDVCGTRCEVYVTGHTLYSQDHEKQEVHFGVIIKSIDSNKQFRLMDQTGQCLGIDGWGNDVRLCVGDFDYVKIQTPYIPIANAQPYQEFMLYSGKRLVTPSIVKSVINTSLKRKVATSMKTIGLLPSTNCWFLAEGILNQLRLPASSNLIQILSTQIPPQYFGWKLYWRYFFAAICFDLQVEAMVCLNEILESDLAQGFIFYYGGLLVHIKAWIGSKEENEKKTEATN